MKIKRIEGQKNSHHSYKKKYDTLSISLRRIHRRVYEGVGELVQAGRIYLEMYVTSPDAKQKKNF